MTARLDQPCKHDGQTLHQRVLGSPWVEILCAKCGTIIGSEVDWYKDWLAKQSRTS